jgi:hypothetical protein
MIQRRKTEGDSGLEALRVLKRRLSDVVYAALRADLHIAAVSRALDRGARDSPKIPVLLL